MTPLRIHVYTPSWNEETHLPKFFRHYGRGRLCTAAVCCEEALRVSPGFASALALRLARGVFGPGWPLLAGQAQPTRATTASARCVDPCRCAHCALALTARVARSSYLAGADSMPATTEGTSTVLTVAANSLRCWETPA